MLSGHWNEQTSNANGGTATNLVNYYNHSNGKNNNDMPLNCYVQLIVNNENQLH